jgi:methionyl-tRNA formyltransferase
MVSAGLRVVYFGTPAFAVPSLRRLMESRHQVVGVVSQPDRPKGRGQRVQQTPTKEVALEQGVPILQPERLKDVEFLDRLSALRPDLGVVAAYGKILPDVVLAVPPLGMINVHASILPKYRGAAPVHRAVMAGDAETGVTIMRVIRELDAGPTFAMRRRAIGEDETSVDVEAALADIGADLLLDVVDAMASGRSVETPQDDRKATFAPKLTKGEGRIDWTLPAVVTHNLVRGLHPWPLASTRLDAARLLIHRTQKVPATFPQKVPATFSRPGSVFVEGRSELSVACGDGKLLRILEIQPEGGRVMSIRDFLAGHRIRPGALLEAP